MTALSLRPTVGMEGLSGGRHVLGRVHGDGAVAVCNVRVHAGGAGRGGVVGGLGGVVVWGGGGGVVGRGRLLVGGGVRGVVGGRGGGGC